MDRIEPGFFLCVTRPLPYKNVPVLIEAMRSLPMHRMVVVGVGPLHEKVKISAPPNITFLGKVNDSSLRWLYANAIALVTASYEDYGLTPLEAASFGKPSVVLRAGGFLDTVIEGDTGVFFDSPNPSLAREAMITAASTSWNRPSIIEHSRKYSVGAFIRRLREIVAPASRP